MAARRFNLPPLIDEVAKADPKGYAAHVYENQFKKGLGVGIGDGQDNPYLGRKNRGLMPWEDSAKAFGTSDIIPDTPLVERAAYGAGRLAGAVASDNLRSWFWRYNHPLAIAKDVGGKIPKAAGLVDHTGKPQYLPTVLSGFALATALDAFSGNTDLTNMAEGGRPKGYSALLPSPEDPTKSENLAVEIPLGYVTGRKGKLLPWEDFSKERPDVSPEQYQQYKAYQGFGTPGLFGLEKANPAITGVLGAAVGGYLGQRDPNGTSTGKRRLAGGLKGATVGSAIGALVPGASELISSMGILKGTTSNLEGQPEAQLLGYKVPLSGLLATVGIGAGLYGVNKHIADKQRARYVDDLQRKASQQRPESPIQLVNHLTPIEKEYQALSPEIKRGVDKALWDIEQHESFKNLSPEMQERVRMDQAKKQGRLQGYRDPETNVLNTEMQGKVDEVVKLWLQRKGLPE